MLYWVSPQKEKNKLIGNLVIIISIEKVDYSALVEQRALIVDVRSAHEFATRHIEGSINVPLIEINSKTDTWQKKRQTSNYMLPQQCQKRLGKKHAEHGRYRCQ